MTFLSVITWILVATGAIFIVLCLLFLTGHRRCRYVKSYVFNRPVDAVWELLFPQPGQVENNIFYDRIRSLQDISHGIGRSDRRFGFEIEGQVVRHFGDQDHWEFNFPIVGRWKAFPWDGVVDTSLAFGIGPSYASEKPKVEVTNKGDSQRLLVYWMAEIEVGPPDKSWSTIFRIHHRSGAYGLVADEGGSNAMVIGFKRRF